MVRRVGFGDGGAERDEEARRPPEPPEGGAESDGESRPPPVVPEKTWVRLVLAGFIALWLAGWSWGIWVAFQSIGEIWARFGQDGFDWFGLGFMAVWLFFALIGWAFGVVILVVMLFGKPVTPERRAEKEARRAARRAAREARRR